jgi:hypothetical protein
MMLNRKMIELSTSTITDATASVGGNVLAFACHFVKVNAIELLEPTTQMLLHNLKLLKFSHKVDVWCGDSSHAHAAASNMVQDTLFLGPLWGQKHYRRVPRLSYFLTEENVRQVCIEWARCPRLIVLELPQQNGTGLDVYTYNTLAHLEIGGMLMCVS